MSPARSTARCTRTRALRLARRAEALAAELAPAVERRFQADEVPFLDVGVSRAWLARARSERLAAEAGREAALGELRLLLGMSPEEALSVRGDLRDRRRLRPRGAARRRGAAPVPARARGGAARSRGGRAPGARRGLARRRPRRALRTRRGRRPRLRPARARAAGLRARTGPARGSQRAGETPAPRPRRRDTRGRRRGVHRVRGARAPRGGARRARGERAAAARRDRVARAAQLRRRADRPLGVSGGGARRPGRCAATMRISCSRRRRRGSCSSRAPGCCDEEHPLRDGSPPS